MPAISVRDASSNGPDKPTGSAQVAVPAAIVEARPAPTSDPLERSLHQAVEQVFLSPRVIDQRAFDEFAGQLSKLTRDAGKAGESLAATHGQVKALHEQLRGLIGDLTTKTDAAIKALPIIEAKAAKVQQLMTHVGNETAIAKARELRDSVAQELLSQRDGLVQQLVNEIREAVIGNGASD
jgi:predicted trehalose synthase